MKKIVLLINIIICLFFCFNVSAKELVSGAKGAILIESSTNYVMYEKEANTRLKPASMTKIMTLLLVYEAMENNVFNKDTILDVSQTASSMGGSRVYLSVGEKISVDECIKCVCVASANDAAVLLAEAVSGSEINFVSKMNERAIELGCKNTNFLDCSGLSDDDHYTTAYDLAIIASYLINTYPDVLNYTNIKEDYIRKDSENPFWIVNTNKLIGKVLGIYGLKTGYTSSAKYCITLVMKKGDMTLISVVFGYLDKVKRNTESVELLNYGFDNYERIKVVNKGDTYDEFKSIYYTPYKNYIVVSDDLYILKKKDSDYDYSIDYEYDVNENNYNDVLGYVYVRDFNNDILVKSELKFKDAVYKNSLLQILIRIIGIVFGDVG